MKKIIILVDYKKHFESKWDAFPYRSGMDKKLMSKYFLKESVSVEFIPVVDAFNLRNIENTFILYTSSEDNNYYYKNFIEDIIYYLKCRKAILIPDYKFLHAHNNKVFMELLKKIYEKDFQFGLSSWIFGSLEELNKKYNEFKYPVIMKDAEGALSRGVHLVASKEQLIKFFKRISKTSNYFEKLKDLLRPLIHKNYVRESLYRKKIIVQEFIPNLKNDWKILIYGNKYFIFSRPVKKGDFRASGSGIDNYSFGSKCKYPKGILDYAKQIFDLLNVPQLSIDVAFDGTSFYLLEFQAIFIGTVGFSKSDIYFIREDQKWFSKKKTQTLEEVYVQAVLRFIKKKYNDN